MIMRLLIILVVILASEGGQYGGDPGGAGAVNRVPAPASVKESFRIFHTSAELLPTAVRTHLSHLLKPPGHPFAPTLVQRSRSAQAGVIWAFVMKDQICLAEGSQGGAVCDDLNVAASEGLSLGTFSPPSERIPRPHDFTLTGLVPDHVLRVKVSIGHHIRVVAVHENVYSVTADQAIFIRRLTYRQ
jgi:hypothetical protein